MTSLATLQWLGVRVAVGTTAFAVVLGLAQLTVYLLIAAYAQIPPYAGA
jgi:hypothetical protein